MAGTGKCVICRRENVQVDLYNGIYQCGFCRRNAGGKHVKSHEERPKPFITKEDVRTSLQSKSSSDKPLLILGATGSRQLKVKDKEEKQQVWSRVLNRVRKATDTYQVVIVSGMAEGMDELFAWVAIKLQLPLVLAIPNFGYRDYYWGKNSLTGKDRTQDFKSFVAYSKETGAVFYVMEDVYGRTREIYLWVEGRKIHSNFIRNEWMVSICDYFFIYDPESRGTKHCYARILEADLPHEIVG